MKQTKYTKEQIQEAIRREERKIAMHSNRREEFDIAKKYLEKLRVPHCKNHFSVEHKSLTLAIETLAQMSREYVKMIAIAEKEIEILKTMEK